MNRQFSLPATPALARQLLLVSSVFGLDLDDKIKDLAATDLEDFSHLTIDPRHHRHIQQIIDYSFRCVVQGNFIARSRQVLLSAVIQKGVQCLTIVTPNSRKEWEPLLEANGITHGRDASKNPEALFVKPAHINERDLMASRRHGLLIWEISSPASDLSFMRGPYLEFHKSVILVSGDANDISYMLDNCRAIMYPKSPAHRGNSIRKLSKEQFSVIFRVIHLEHNLFLKDNLYSGYVQTEDY